MNKTFLLFIYTGLIAASALFMIACNSKVKEKKVVVAHTSMQSQSVFKFIGSTSLSTGFSFKNTEVGGLSGIDYDKQSDLFYAISDDRGSTNYPRFYTLKIDLADGKLSDGDIEFVSVTEILDTNNARFPEGDLDPEAIRYHTDTQLLYWANEGDRDRWLAPTVRAMNTEGKFISDLSIPESFVPKPDQGIRDNKSLESLALSVDGKHVYTATETSLYQDGPAVSHKSGSLSRLAKIELATNQVEAEFIYPTEAIAKKPFIPGLFATNGLVELLAINQDSLLALERSFTLGKGNTIRIFLTSTQSATNIKGELSITQREESVVPMPKRLLLDLDTLQIPLDNIEAISFGPTLANGDSTLVLVSDNNFNAASQSTLFLAFAFNLEDLNFDLAN